MRLLCLLLLAAPLVAQSTVPETPQPQPKPATARPKYLAFGNQKKALRTNKQVFTDPTFLIPVGGCATSMITDVLVTNGAREHFHSEAPVVGFIAGLSYLTHRYLWAPFASGMGGYCIQHYARDAMQ